MFVVLTFVINKVENNGEKRIHNCLFELERRMFCSSFLTWQLPTNKHVIVSSDVSCFLIKQVCAQTLTCAWEHQGFHVSQGIKLQR